MLSANLTSLQAVMRHFDTVRPVLSGHSKKDRKKMFKTNYRSMQVKNIILHSALFSTCIELPHGFKTFVLSIFERLLKTGFTVTLFKENHGDPKIFRKINLIKKEKNSDQTAKIIIIQ